MKEHVESVLGDDWLGRMPRSSDPTSEVRDYPETVVDEMVKRWTVGFDAYRRASDLPSLPLVLPDWTFDGWFGKYMRRHPNHRGGNWSFDLDMSIVEIFELCDRRVVDAAR